jgi:hypothetical protein
VSGVEGLVLERRGNNALYMFSSPCPSRIRAMRFRSRGGGFNGDVVEDMAAATYSQTREYEERRCDTARGRTTQSGHTLV